ncbi:hypothetical protein PCASD_03823 [Puccinia coronata f. sp. avenae]|uniref:Protein BTN n=1 Tax=Puccinia coronata f. sp. avenae TaxID=200324 RepID=A0A2N5V2S2_9BASI|nr:hypothetical protein PCASD_03823 [Puccinia coronata f. sp. avenae]
MAYKLSPIHKPVPLKSTTHIRFSLALFLFGLLNNVLYVIILSAALDLVPSDVPTGVILVADITPSLLVKIGWPYFVKGKIRYARRILSCSALSFAGMMVLPICLSFTYFFLLPPPNQLPPATLNEDEAGRGSYEIVPASSDQAPMLPPLKPSELTFPEKLRLARPLLIPYMLPLFAVYFAGIYSALIPQSRLPSSTLHPGLNRILSSHLSSNLTRLLSLLAADVPNLCVFLALLDGDIPVPGAATETDPFAESTADGDPWIYMLVFAVISLEGVCGGLAYVSAYYWLGMDGHNLDQEKEFRIACVGFADTFGSVLELPFISPSRSHVKHSHPSLFNMFLLDVEKIGSC